MSTLLVNARNCGGNGRASSPLCRLQTDERRTEGQQDNPLPISLGVSDVLVVLAFACPPNGGAGLLDRDAVRRAHHGRRLARLGGRSQDAQVRHRDREPLALPAADEVPPEGTARRAEVPGADPEDLRGHRRRRHRAWLQGRRHQRAQGRPRLGLGGQRRERPPAGAGQRVVQVVVRDRRPRPQVRHGPPGRDHVHHLEQEDLGHLLGVLGLAALLLLRRHRLSPEPRALQLQQGRCERQDLVLDKVGVNGGGTPGNGDTGGFHGGGSTGGSTGGSGGTSGGTGTPTSHGGDGDGWTRTGPPRLSDSKLPVQITVPTDDSVVTPYALQAGHHYKVTVSGSYTYGSVRTSWSGDDRTPLVADAECLQQPDWSDGALTTAWSRTPDYGGDYRDVLFDLSVDRMTSWQPVVDDGNGCNSTDHRYVLHLTPTQTMPLYLHVVGGDHLGGAGSLSVTVSRDGS